MFLLRLTSKFILEWFTDRAVNVFGGLETSSTPDLPYRKTSTSTIKGTTTTLHYLTLKNEKQQAVNNQELKKNQKKQKSQKEVNLSVKY